MKKITFLCLVLSFFPALGCSESIAPPAGINSNNPEALSILPLGDSITQANSKNLSYRAWLWKMLVDENITADFVGTQDSNYEGNPEFPADFDTNHQGHWGWRTDQILEELPEWLKHYKADLGLIHLGTNDCLKHQPVQETLGELEQIVMLLRQENPSIDLIFSPLGPTNWKGNNCLIELNSGLQKLADNLDSPNNRVLLAKRSQLLDLESHLYDGLHPNAEGEKIIAAMWFQAIRSLDK